jgi:hypothetical protein
MMITPGNTHLALRVGRRVKIYLAFRVARGLDATLDLNRGSMLLSRNPKLPVEIWLHCGSWLL